MAHPGIARMKATARFHCWWPGMDKEIEALAGSCPGCRENRNAPAQITASTFSKPSEPWVRIHIDFGGRFLGHMFLVCVDAYSKWPEVKFMKRTQASDTIKVLRGWFAQHGLPKLVVSDNGPQLVSAEFLGFLQSNGVEHQATPPYHPKSNGEAEKFVQTLKQALLKANSTHESAEDDTNRFLLQYRTCPHTTTGKTPAELLQGRRLRSRLDLLHPEKDDEPKVKATEAKELPPVKATEAKEFPPRKQKPGPKRTKDTPIEKRSTKGHLPKVRKFQAGEWVYVRNYAKGAKWILAQVVQKLSPLVYLVSINGKPTKRHLEQISGKAVEVQEEQVESENHGQWMMTYQAPIPVQDEAVLQPPVVVQEPGAQAILQPPVIIQEPVVQPEVVVIEHHGQVHAPPVARRNPPRNRKKPKRYEP
jgi:hypothetical protein